MRLRTITVVETGALTTVQDRGRGGLAHLGVPRAGALDAPAAALANRLVGNPADAAVLEVTLGGFAVQVSVAMSVAVTGAAAAVTVDGRPVAFAEPVSVGAGATVRIGPATEGVRCYLALAGGVAVPPVLGSRSTDTLAGIGPPPVEVGAVLPVGPVASAPGATDVPVVRRTAPAGDALRLRFRPGPRADWFTPDALRTLTGSTYAVAAESNRIGLRLEGAPLTRSRAGELPSEGIVLGAIQVPASGQPLVFLHDHPTTGGYPVVGVVHPDDVWLCAQLRPGAPVRFTD